MNYDGVDLNRWNREINARKIAEQKRLNTQRQRRDKYIQAALQSVSTTGKTKDEIMQEAISIADGLIDKLK